VGEADLVRVSTSWHAPLTSGVQIRSLRVSMNFIPLVISPPHNILTLLPVDMVAQTSSSLSGGREAALAEYATSLHQYTRNQVRQFHYTPDFWQLIIPRSGWKQGDRQKLPLSLARRPHRPEATMAVSCAKSRQNGHKDHSISTPASCSTA